MNISDAVNIISNFLKNSLIKDNTKKMIGPLSVEDGLNKLGITIIDDNRFLNSTDVKFADLYKEMRSALKKFYIGRTKTYIFRGNPNSSVHLLKLINIQEKEDAMSNIEDRVSHLFPPIVDEFWYLFVLIKNIIRGEKPIVNEINLCGPRQSGKTWAIALFFLTIILLPKKIKCLYIRHLMKDAIESFDDIYNRTHEFFPKQKWTIHKNKKTISVGKNEIRVLGLKEKAKTRGSAKALLGTKALTAEYAFIFIDEANQVDDDTFSAVKESIRGAKYFVFIRASNPWTLSADYISYCNDYLRFNEKDMITKHQQFKFYKSERKLFHYVGWQLNPHLPEFTKNFLQEMLKTNPIRARVASLGMPGHESGSVYGEELKFLKDFDINSKEWEDIQYLEGGVDIGGTKADTVGILVGFNSDFSKVYIISHYCHNLKKSGGKGFNLMLKEVVEFFGKLEGVPDIYKNKLKKLGIRVHTDFASPGAIETLNAHVINASDEGMFNEWKLGIRFTPCLKKEIHQRVEYIKAAMEMGSIYIDKKRMNCLMKELDLCIWEEGGSKPVRIDKNVDHIDAFEYAIIINMKHILRGKKLMFQNFNL